MISYVALLAGSAGPAACRNVVASGSAALSVAKCAVFFSCVAAEPFLGLGLAQWSAILLVAVAAGQWSTLEGAIRDGKVVSSPPPAKVEEVSKCVHAIAERACYVRWYGGTTYVSIYIPDAVFRLPTALTGPRPRATAAPLLFDEAEHEHAVLRAVGGLGHRPFPGRGVGGHRPSPRPLLIKFFGSSEELE